MISKAIRCAALALFCALACMPALAAHTARPPSEPLTLSGSLSVLIADDFAHKRATTLYSVVVRPGYRVPLQFRDQAPPNLRTGMKIEVSGQFDGERLSVDPAAGFRVLAAAPAAAIAPTAVTHKSLMILIDLVDGLGVTHHLSQTCDGTEEGTADIMFGTKTANPNVDEAYLESSFGKEGFGGAAYPGNALDVVRVLINDPGLGVSSVCSYDSWANQADTLVAAAGVNLADYQHRVYVLHEAAGCSWGGLGEVACGVDCRAWEMTYSYYVCGTRGAHAHEVGHNLGFMHASTDDNNDGVIDSEYGDTSDFMGNNYDTIQQTSSPHKRQLGWIDDAHVVDGSAGGSFTIAASELANPALPQLVKITPANGLPYYLSYRAPIGYDVNAPAADYRLRTSVHRWAGGISNTLLVGSLGDGGSILDTANALFIKQVSHDATSALVQVATNAVCARANPSVAITPASISTASPTAQLSYTISVTNNDGGYCPPGGFTLRASAASANVGLNIESFWLAPGQTSSATLMVNPTSPPNGTYAVSGWTLADAVHASATANANYVMNVPCYPGRPTLLLVDSILSTSSVPHTWTTTMTVQNTDTGSNCPASSFDLSMYVQGWSSAVSPATVTVAAGATAQATVQLTAPAGTPAGTYGLIALSAANATHAASQQDVGIAQVILSCTRNAPSALLSDQQTITAVPGSKSYTLTILNNDQGPCAGTTFGLAGTAPTGWSESFSPTNLTLAAGATGTSTVTVSVPAGAINGPYNFKAGTRLETNHPAVRATGGLIVSVGSGGTCTVAAPTAVLSPSSQTTTTLPKALAYTLTVSNKDSSACASSSFALSTQVPSGWTGSVSPTSMSLAPGASATATFTANAPTTAGNATYTVKAGTAAAGGHTAALGAASAVVNVASGGSDTTPPTTPGNLSGALNAAGSVVLSWSASTDSGSGVANYKVYKNNALFATTTATTLTKLVTRGTWSFYVVAIDKAGNISAHSNTVTVSK